uniref:Uncharacterized protein n=1 Tax=Plectus sambesii TaxID=2011161 RepID=A0A914UNF1_9BILA
MDHFRLPCSSSCFFSTQEVANESGRQQILTARRPFAVLNQEVRAKAMTISNDYQLIDMKHRLPILDEEEWRIYLSTLGKMYLPDYMHFGYDQTENLQALIERIAPFCGRLAPIDFYNYLRFVDAFDIHQELADHLIWCSELPLNISKWFLDRYESIECGAFFQILKLKTRFLRRNSLLFHSENEEEASEYLRHGFNLLEQPQSDICDCLDMLFLLQVYGRTSVGGNSNSLIAPTLDRLAAKDLPNSLDDVYNSLQIICDEKLRKKRALSTPEFEFYRHARKNKAAWQWLRNSIELVFEEDDLERLRPLAAAAAVRAFIFKAVDFSPEQVNRYLSIAADPYLENPAIVFETQKSEEQLPNRRIALSHLIYAVFAAVVNSDLRNSLTVRLNDAYWRRFFDIFWREAAKMTGPEGAVLYREVRCALYPPNALKVRRPLRNYFEAPVNARRDEQLDIMKKKFRLKVFNASVGDVLAEDLAMLMREEHLAA